MTGATNDVMPLLQRALAAHQRQNFAKAEASCRRVVSLNDRAFEALHCCRWRPVGERAGVARRPAN